MRRALPSLGLLGAGLVVLAGGTDRAMAAPSRLDGSLTYLSRELPQKVKLTSSNYSGYYGVKALAVRPGLAPAEACRTTFQLQLFSAAGAALGEAPWPVNWAEVTAVDSLGRKVKFTTRANETLTLEFGDESQGRLAAQAMVFLQSDCRPMPSVAEALAFLSANLKGLKVYERTDDQRYWKATSVSVGAAADAVGRCKIDLIVDGFNKWGDPGAKGGRLQLTLDGGSRPYSSSYRVYIRDGDKIGFSVEATNDEQAEDLTRAFTALNNACAGASKPPPA